MAKTIRIRDSIPKIEVVLSDGKNVELRRPGRRARRQGPWSAQRPGWGNASAATDSLLANASQGDLAEAELHGLRKTDRRRLILGVVCVSGSESDWRRLYGSSLTPDERFLATVIWAERREAREAQTSLRAMRQRLIERAPTDMGNAPRVPSGITGLKKQFEAMNSLRRIAQGTSLFSNFQSPALAGLGSQIGTNLGVNSTIAEIAKTSFPSFELESPALSKVLMSPAGSAGLNAEMPKIASQMGVLSVAKEMRMGAFGDSYRSNLSSIAKQFELASGASSIAKQLDLFSGPASITKQFDHLLGRNAFKGFGGDLTGILPQLDPTKFGFSGNIWRQTQEMMESFLVAELTRLWGEDPLWFLIGYLNPRRLPALLSTSREKVFEAVLDGLERVVRSSTLIEQLIAACEGLVFLTTEQRAWLKHGLEHARQGDWVQAMPPLILGFEGAIFNGAVAAEVIAGREGKKLPAEKVIKAINLDADLEAFAIRLVFGGSGNAIRHGRPENEVRDQALPLIVALVGWLDFTLGTSGMATLASALDVVPNHVVHPDLLGGWRCRSPSNKEEPDEAPR